MNVLESHSNSEAAGKLIEVTASEVETPEIEVSQRGNVEYFDIKSSLKPVKIENNEFELFSGHNLYEVSENTPKANQVRNDSNLIEYEYRPNI